MKFAGGGGSWDLFVPILFGATLFFAPSRANADGKRDLEDGIAFYENLDTDRALERLKAASQAKDLAKPERAKAFLYLGMVYFENGDKPHAQTAWKSAFELERNVQVPAGTSPKTIEAIEVVRAESSRPPEASTEPGGVKTETPPPLPGTQPGDIKPPELVETKTPPPVEDDDTTTWLIIGGIGAAAVAAGVVILLIAAGGGGDCAEGGCLTVTFQ